MLMVAPFEWRSYSIAAVDGRRLTLLISTRTGGDGSIFIRDVKPGTETKIELPFGAFRLRQNNHQKVFIETGTGIAPFMPMFAAMADAGQLESAELLFGCRFAKDNVTSHLSLLPRKTICVCWSD
jgi:all-trans-retinol 13,14-reductase